MWSSAVWGSVSGTGMEQSLLSLYGQGWARFQQLWKFRQSSTTTRSTFRFKYVKHKCLSSQSKSTITQLKEKELYGHYLLEGSFHRHNLAQWLRLWLHSEHDRYWYEPDSFLLLPIWKRLLISKPRLLPVCPWAIHRHCWCFKNRRGEF